MTPFQTAQFEAESDELEERSLGRGFVNKFNHTHRYSQGRTDFYDFTPLGTTPTELNVSSFLLLGFRKVFLSKVIVRKTQFDWGNDFRDCVRASLSRLKVDIFFSM